MSFIFNIMLALLWGGLLSVVLVVLLYLLVRALYPSCKLTLLSGLVMFVLWIFVFVQSTMMVGALYAKGYVDDLKTMVATFMEKGTDVSDSLNYLQQADQLKQNLSEQYPILESYLDRLDISELLDRNMPVEIVLAEGIKEMIHFYILRRVLWMLAFLLVGGILYHSFQRKGSSYSNTYNTTYSSTMKF